MKDINGNLCPMKLEESINRSFKIVEEYCNSNELEQAIIECKVHSHNDIYYSFLKSLFLTLKAMLTFDQNDMNTSLESLMSTIKLCDSIRRKGFIRRLLKIIRSTNYDNYSENEIHAELTFAMCSSSYAVLSIMNNQRTGFIDLLSIINRLRIAKNSFKECRLIFEKRTSWQSRISKINFEAGICLERGLRHLLISYFPPKLFSITKFLGYRGVRDIAYNELTKSAYKMVGIYSRLAEISLLTYILFVDPVSSCCRKRLDICDVILEKRLNTHPNCIAYRMYKAKFTLMNGEIDASTEQFEELVKDKNEIYHKLSHYELMWISALTCRWDQCIQYSKLLREQTYHSPIITTYCEAVFTYFKAYKSGDDKLKAESTSLLKTVLKLSPRNIKDPFSFEKRCIKRAEEYFDNNEYLFIPIMSMLYNGNLFYLIEGNVPLLESHLKLVEDEMKDYLKKPDSERYVNYYLDSLFYKGVLMKHMRRLIEAQHCFNTILEDIDNIEDDKSLIPQTLMELGLIQMIVNNKKEAKKCFQKALKLFSGYITESLVHIRTHSALKDLNSNAEGEDKNHLNANIIEEYARRVSELTMKV